MSYGSSTYGQWITDKTYLFIKTKVGKTYAEIKVPVFSSTYCYDMLEKKGPVAELRQVFNDLLAGLKILRHHAFEISSRSANLGRG